MSVTRSDGGGAAPAGDLGAVVATERHATSAESGIVVRLDRRPDGSTSPGPASRAIDDAIEQVEAWIGRPMVVRDDLPPATAADERTGSDHVVVVADGAAVRDGGRIERAVDSAHRNGWPIHVVATRDSARTLRRDHRVRVVSVDDPAELARRIAWDVQDDELLKHAWATFATWDRLADRLRRTFRITQSSILLLGVLATLLGLLDAHITGRQFHAVALVVPILVSVLIAWSSRRSDGQRWLMLRAAAESAKAEIYEYRTRTAAGASRRRRSTLTRGQLLEASLDAIENRLIRTEASSGPLTPYTGVLPPPTPWFVGHDDGLSPLSPDEYLARRVDDQISYFHARVRTLHRLRTALELVAILSGAAGALVAALGVPTWIGLTTGVSTAALAYLSSLQTDNSIIAYNRTSSRLSHLERWWRSLPADEHEQQFARLVADAESALMHERSGWMHHMSEALQELKRGRELAARGSAPGIASASAHAAPGSTEQA